MADHEESADGPARLALIEFCRRPDQDPNGFLGYDVRRLGELVEAAIDETSDDRFLLKVLEDYGWDPNQGDFDAHQDEGDVNLNALATTLETKSSVPRFVGIKFCSECNNMMVPTANTDDNTLMYMCLSCVHVKVPARNNCIYVNRISRGADTLTQVNKDLAVDPTLPHVRRRCPECGTEDAVSFQAQSRREKSNMMLFYVCTDCGHKWKD